MPTKAGRSKFLGAMKIHNIKTITDDFREKLRPRPGDAFNGTAYRVLGDDGAVIPPLDRAMTADDILGRDSLYGIFELVHRGYMGLVQGPEMEINDGDAFRFEITGMEEFPCRPFQGIFMARPVSRPASRPESVAYAKAPPEVGAGTETATKPPIEEPDRIVCAGKYGLMGSETLEAYGNVRGMWKEHAIGDGRSCPVLRDDERTFNPKRGLKPGDVFSSILMNYRKGEGRGTLRYGSSSPIALAMRTISTPACMKWSLSPLVDCTRAGYTGSRFSGPPKGGEYTIARPS